MKAKLLFYFSVGGLINAILAATPPPCDSPLGLQSGELSDKNMTASASLDNSRVPHHGRLNGFSAWCSTGDIASSWLRISFGGKYRVTGMMIQGSKADFIWVTTYRVEYKLQGGMWTKYPKELIGNSNTDYPAGKMSQFTPALIAHDVRVHPLTVNGVTAGSESIDSACLRMELYGCREFDSCIDPGNITNGWRNGKSFRHGDHLNFFCRPGYRTKGFSRSTCVNGKWTTEKPTCEVLCQSPGIINNRNHTIHVSTSGQVVVFTCSPGFDRFGPSSARCVKGKWNQPIPLCRARCRHPGLPSHGIIESLNLRHGGHARYRCDLEFSLVGSAGITCTDGIWNSVPPMCKGGCSDPGKPVNGGRRGHNFNNGRSVSFNCAPGFTLVGVKRITCNAGEWSGKVPKCRGSCQNPGIPRFGMRSGDNFKHGGRVYFFCRDGYTLSGKGKAFCRDGQWSAKAPKCEAMCPDPGAPQNGARIGNNFQNSRTVTFVCNATGFDLVGSRMIRCQNGTWSSATPTCKARCPDPGVPVNGIKISADLRHGGQAVYKCVSGYKPTGSSVLTCRDGKWDDFLPMCVEEDDGNGSGNGASCIDPGIPVNGGRHGSTFRDGQKLTFFCQRGYALFGPLHITCSDGTWSGGVPVCRDSCKDPGIPRNGGRHNDNFAEGQRVAFYCLLGYVLDGRTEIMCVSGKWSGNTPVCRARGCRSPPVPQNARVYGRRKPYYKNSERIFYFCLPGHYSAGRRDQQCIGNTWSKASIRCILRGCGDPGTPRNGFKIGLVYTARSKVYYTCWPGHKMIGNPQRTCQNNGTWTSKLPRCIPVQCRSLPTPLHGVKEVLRTTYLGKTLFRCVRRGYELVGSKMRECQANGIWSGFQPVCSKVTCSDPGTPAFGSRISQGRFAYKNNIHFACNPGYALQGHIRIVCLDDGTWSGDIPKCIGTQRCPLNWKKYRGSCYFFKHHTLRKQIWKRLRKRCNKQNARLLHLHDKQEWNFVKRHLRSSVSRYAIGLQKSMSGSWRWSSGVAVGFAKWKLGESGANVNCGAMQGSDGMYTKMRCGARLSAYICKKNA